ncbi:MAG: hypothetical protein ACLPXT_00200 [Terracidiphilus sp.]
MKRKLLLAILAIIPALFMPLAATSQLIHARHREAPAEKPTAAHKYEVFAGYGYTSLNQVSQSRYGLQGVNISVTRDWGRFFGLTADGAYYKYPLKTGGAGSDVNPGDPSVNLYLMGPVLHAPIFGHVDGYLHALLGVAHTGGENATPDVSFAGGYGGGLDYKLFHNLSLRLGGDDIQSSFLANANSSVCGTGSNCSAHKHGNSRAEFGVVYKF